MTTHANANDYGLSTARFELKRAYMLVEYEEWEHALAACDRALERAPDHPLPRAIKGSILTARGDLGESIRTLRRGVRAHPEHALTRLYLAEALLLDGKILAGQRALEAAAECSDFDRYYEMAELLSATLLKSIGETGA